MKNLFGDYFYFNKNERKVIFTVLVAVVVLRLLPLTFPMVFRKSETFNFPEMPKFGLSHQAHQTKLAEEREIREFPFNPNLASREDFSSLGLSERLINTICNFRNKGGKFYKPEDLKKIWGLSATEYQRLAPYINIETASNYPVINANQSNTNDAVSIELFPFSPNLASIEDLIKLGISQKVAQKIINYRSKGGVFRKKEDLQKIYGFPIDLYAKLEPFIVLESSNSNNTSTLATQNQGVAQNQTTTSYPNQNYNIPNQIPGSYNNTPSTTQYSNKKNFSGSIDINQATTEQWQQLPGIGAGYANKIISFRDKLGGFYSPEQIKETYGLPDSTFQKIKVHLKASPVLRTININNATQEELNKHPYCKTNHARLIVNYRETHGKFANLEALKKVYGIQDILPKLQPYITF